jgi:hypothetical protein
MKRKPFFHSRVLAAGLLCSGGLLLAAFSFAAQTTTTASSNIASSDWSIVNSPNPPPSPIPNNILGSTCVSASDCWAVGYSNDGNPDRTLILHWDGNAWALFPSPNSSATQPNQLYAVACSSTSNCWAVGYYFGENAYQTLIEHWNGLAWTIVSSPNASTVNPNILTGVTCTSASNCWAVGYFSTGATDQTLIEHWDGNNWTVVNSPNTDTSFTNRLLAVTCASTSDCWSVGFATINSTDQTLTEHWNGNAWSIVTSANTDSARTNYLLSISCLSASECWAVGRANNGAADQTLVERWDGTAWALVSSSNTNSARDNLFSSVTCLSSTNCWATGYYLEDSQIAYQTLVEHWDGTAWNIIPSDNTSPIQHNVLSAGVSCASVSDCWTIGNFYNDNGIAQPLVEHWDGTAWSVVSSEGRGIPQNNFLSGITCTSMSDCWTVGYYIPANGTFHRTLIEHWDGLSWTLINSPNNGTRDNQLYEVTCTSASNCWAAGFYGNGSAWQTLIERWDGTAWTVVSSPNTSTTLSNYLLGVACTSASNCFAVGYANDGIIAYRTLIEQWNGSSWAIITSPNFGPFDNILDGTTCTSASDCWAVGYYSNGTVNQTLIEHWNGTAWTVDVTSADTSIMQNNYLAAVSCTSTSNCWAAGHFNNGTADQTLIERWNGTSWSVVGSPNDSATRTNYLYGVACASDTNCWAVGYYDNGKYQTLIEQWDGAGWSIAPSPNVPITQQNVLTGVTCPSASNCWSSGFYGNGATLILRYPPLVPPTLLSVVSRKTHGSAGTFDLTLNPATPATIEPRGITSGDHTLVFSFLNVVSAVSSVAATATTSSGTLPVTVLNTSGIGTDTRQYIVNLSGVPNASHLGVTLNSVADLAGSVGDVSAQMDVLLGDVNSTGRTDSGDVTAVRNHTVSIPDQQTFQFDVNASGRIDSGDVTVTRNASVTVLP